MCYSNCPYETSQGECKGNQYFEKFDAHCNTTFTCNYCGEKTNEEMASTEVEGICFECEQAYLKENE